MACATRMEGYPQIQFQPTANLSSDLWVNLTNFIPANSPIQLVDRAAANIPVRFYRVVSP